MIRRFGSSVGRRLAQAVPLAAWECLPHNPRLVLCYHAVAAARIPHLTGLYPYKEPSQFVADIDYLKERYQIADYDRLRDIEAGGRANRSRAATLTFDDGLAQCWTDVLPKLRKARVHAVFFVTSGVVDNTRMLDRHKRALCVNALRSADPDWRARRLPTLWRILGGPQGSAAEVAIRLLDKRRERSELTDPLCEALDVDWRGYLKTFQPYVTSDQLREMASEGHVIGGHGTDHTHFQALTRSQREQQVLESCEFAAGVSGRSSVPFAFPFGGTQPWIEELRELRGRTGLLDLVFGTAGFLSQSGVVNRVLADDPHGADRSNSNLPALIAEGHIARVRPACQQLLSRG